jgi:hypothetical protein
MQVRSVSAANLTAFNLKYLNVFGLHRACSYLGAYCFIAGHMSVPFEVGFLTTLCQCLNERMFHEVGQLEL